MNFKFFCFILRNTSFVCLPVIESTMDKTYTPQTPQTPVRGRSRIHNYPLSSPYSGKSPISIPILLPGQYEESNKLQSESDELVNSDDQKIEIFDKLGGGKLDIVIPPVGFDLEDTPFFSNSISTQFLNSINGISNQMLQLNKVNESVVDLNESLGAYLFGLFQNAWCVNLNESLNLETIEKIEKIETVKKLKSKLNELKTQLDNAKRRESFKKSNEQKRSIMPPPSASGFNRSLSSSNRNNRALLKRNRNEALPADENTPIKRTFLRAGSRNATFKQRQNRMRPSNASSTGLNILSATKLRIQNKNESDDSMSSVGDTSEVQTLNSIRQMSRFKNNNDRDRTHLPKSKAKLSRWR